MARKGLVRGLPVLSQVKQVCEACLTGKHHRMPFPHAVRRHSTEVLELVRDDLCGLITLVTPSGKQYFLLLVDDYTRYMWVALLATKGAVPVPMQHIQAGDQLNKYFTELGVRREQTTSYTLQHNGVIERRNQTVVSMMHSMLKAKGLPVIFWGEAVTAAVCTLNSNMTKGNQGRTLYKLWVHSTLVLHHLRTFGCVAHIKTIGNLKKLDDRSKPAIFIGYEPRSKAYHTYDLVSK
jgi:hypothetical protein